MSNDDFLNHQWRDHHGGEERLDMVENVTLGEPDDVARVENDARHQGFRSPILRWTSWTALES